MEELKLSDFMQKGTMVYGCGVQRKTEKGYRRGVELENANLALKTTKNSDLVAFREQAGVSK